MDDYVEPVPVHATAFMPMRNIGKAMRGLERIAAPDMRAIRRVKIDALISCTLNADAINVLKRESASDPARDILVGRCAYMRVEYIVVERCDVARQEVP